MDTHSWIDAIAEESGQDREAVEITLLRLGISLRPELAFRRRLHVSSVFFSGDRRGTGRDGPFEFAWCDLGPGLWALTSGRNFRGKTSVLGVLLWALRGRPPDLTDTVRNWINRVVVRVSLDGRVLEIVLDDARSGRGHLAEIVDGKPSVLSAFGDEAAFERTMSVFFMEQFNLSPMRVFSSRGDGHTGVAAQHGWPWLSTALHIGPRNDVLFGETAIGALPMRMMQMFVGVPAASTLADIKTAEGQLRSQSSIAENARSHFRTQRDQRLAELRSELSRIDARLSALPSVHDDREALAAATAVFIAADKRFRQETTRLASAEARVADARAVYDQDRRRAHQLKEERAAGFVFHALDPVCCPACDADFDNARRTDTASRHVCLVCGANDIPKNDPAPEEARLEASIAASKIALEEANRAMNEINDAIASAKQDRDQAGQRCDRLNGSIQRHAERAQLDASRIALQARIEELERGVPDTTDSASNDAVIIAAAEKVTRNLLNAAQGDLLKDISALILEYGQKFGIENLRETRLDGAGRLKITNADTETTFTRMTAGERTRLKVAAIIAMLRLTERRGLGRHPGLLLIDSPGNNETVPEDYQAMIKGLAEVVKELPHLQIITAACTNPAVSAHVPRAHQRNAVGDGYLW